MIQLQNPPALKKGGTIAIVSPSAGLAELFPHRTEKGVSMLEEMGYVVKVMPNALKRDGWVSASPEERAEDLHAAFRDPEVSAVMAAIGGNHANQILKYLDYDLIRANPKIFVGYSDNTILHYALMSQAALRTFYGPCLVSEFGEHPKVLPYTQESFEAVLGSSAAYGEVKQATVWTDEFLDWFAKADLERPRELRPTEGYEWWRGGAAEGQIIGGAVPTTTYMAGTEYWLDPTGTIFFIDLPEGEPGGKLDLSWLDAYLANLDNLGVFQSIAGLVIGRPYGYQAEDTDTLRGMIDRYTTGTQYPILFNASLGHTAPIITIPLGIQTRLDSSADTFSFLEGGVA